jgi:hypothetical protein
MNKRDIIKQVEEVLQKAFKTEAPFQIILSFDAPGFKGSGVLSNLDRGLTVENLRRVANSLEESQYE